MSLDAEYQPQPGDILTLHESRVLVNWVVAGHVGYQVDYGRGQYDTAHSMSIPVFVKHARRDGLSLAPRDPRGDTHA